MKKINPWPIAIPAFLIFIICFNTWFGITASRGTLPNVESGTYEKGLKYQLVIDKINASKELGWQAKLSADLENKKVKLEVFDRDNQPLVFDKAEVSFVRPSDARLDQKITFTKSTADFQNITTGLWLYELELNAKAETFYEKSQLEVR